MGTDQSQAEPGWLPYLELGCATFAAGLWYALPAIGPWPLFLALAPWALRLAWAGRARTPTAFDLPLLVFLLTAGLGVWAAYDRANAWPQFWLIVGAVFLFSALVHAGPLGSVRVWLLAALGAAVALYFLATNNWDVYPGKVAALTSLGRALQAPLPVLPFARYHPNIAGGILAMMLPFAGLATVQAWQGVRRGDERWPAARFGRWPAVVAAGGALVVILFGLLMTTSRGAWVAVGCAALLGGLWVVAGWLSRSRPGRRAVALLGLVALVLAALLGVAMVWPGGIFGTLGALPGPDPRLPRLELMRNSLTLVRDYPFVGAGLGGFEMLYSTYALLIHVGFITHAHNLYLDVAVQQGGLALVALVWMWLLFAVGVWRGVLHSRAGSGARPYSRGGAGAEAHSHYAVQALAAAALCQVILLVHGAVDDVLYGSRAVVLLFVPLAFAVPYLRIGQGHGRRWTWMVAPVALLLVAILALSLRDRVLSLLYSNLGAIHQSQAELAIYRWPEWPLQDDVRRRVNLSRPVAEFERALALDADNATANRRLGMIELALGRYQAALQYLERAYAAEPGSSTARQLLGEALIVNGRLAEGRTFWAGIDRELGQLAMRAFWYQYIGEKERADWIRQAAGGK